VWREAAYKGAGIVAFLECFGRGGEGEGDVLIQPSMNMQVMLMSTCMCPCCSCSWAFSFCRWRTCWQSFSLSVCSFTNSNFMSSNCSLSLAYKDLMGHFYFFLSSANGHGLSSTSFIFSLQFQNLGWNSVGQSEDCTEKDW
jgi:hypothetical protein